MIRKLSALVLLFVCATGANAQESARTLHWRRLDVVAHLDADGRLHVRERQAMVFDGAWNGGERTFNIRPGQELDLQRVTRIDSAGTPHALTQGDLDVVDHFGFTDTRRLRWRSRLPTDPPFSNQQIVYELEYTLSNILLERGGAYTLDHDFAFPDRAGVIEDFSLALDADAVWQSASLPLRLERANIPPGSSVVVTIPLRYAGTRAPAGVPVGVPASTRLLLLVVLVSGVMLLLIGLVRGESARGRYTPLRPVQYIDDEWLREHVFHIAPEVVGAAWDQTMAAPEVAAFIARMVQEGKLSSRVEQLKRKEILHLTLIVPRTALSEQELKLVEALFEDDATETDTEAIRARYKKKGFNPASIIRTGVLDRVKALTPTPGANPVGVLINLVLFMFILAAGAYAVVMMQNLGLAAVPAITGAAGFVAIVVAAIYRNSVVSLRPKMVVLAAMLLLTLVPAAALLLGLVRAYVPPTSLVLLDLVLLVLAITWFVARIARTRETAERLELRRDLAAARAYFVRELSRPEPALQDEWFPYLLAFGLGKHVDKWFRAFGGVSNAGVIATSAAHASSSSAGWSGGGALFGGSGGFGGGGAGRSWASAVQTFSAGVASPSSGGGGGGGSSGGGGGGGW